MRKTLHEEEGSGKDLPLWKLLADREDAAVVILWDAAQYKIQQANGHEGKLRGPMDASYTLYVRGSSTLRSALRM